MCYWKDLVGEDKQGNARDVPGNVRMLDGHHLCPVILTVVAVIIVLEADHIDQLFKRVVSDPFIIAFHPLPIQKEPVVPPFTVFGTDASDHVSRPIRSYCSEGAS